MRALGARVELQKGKPKIPWKSDFENIIAQWGHSKNGQCVVFVAHYDHNPPMDGRYSPGANDNASGVAALLEVAREVTASSASSDLDWYFVFPDQEENFITGSPSVVPLLSSRCKEIQFATVLDLVGAPFFPGFENHLIVFGAESSRELEHLLVESAQQIKDLKVIGAQIFLIEPLGIPRSDYDAFRKADVPFAFLTTGVPANYHTPEDSLNNIDFALLEKSTRYLLAMVRPLLEGRAPRAYRWVGDDAEELRTESEYLYQGIRVAYLMDRMASKPEENRLTVDEMKWLADSARELRDPSDPPSRLGLQLKVMKLLGLIAKRSPVPNSYLKSFFGKIF